MIDLFLKIFRNKYLRDKIFFNIKELNKELHYYTYNFYNFPINLILKNKENKLLLIEKLKSYENNNNNNNKLEFNNNNNLNLLFEYKEFDLFLLNLINKFIPNYIKCKLNQLILLLENGNLKLFKELEEIVEYKIEIPKLVFNYNNCKKEEILEILQYISWKYLNYCQLNEESIYLNLCKIIDSNKVEEFGKLFLDQLNSEAYHLILIQYSLEKYNKEMFKLIIEKFKEKYKNDLSPFGPINKIYQFINNIIVNNSLIINDPYLSKVILKYNSYQNRIKCTQNCLEDDLSNLSLFKNKKNIEWIINDDITSLQKFDYFNENNLYINCFYFDKFYLSILKPQSQLIQQIIYFQLNQRLTIPISRFQINNQLLFNDVLNYLLEFYPLYYSIDKLIIIYLNTEHEGILNQINLLISQSMINNNDNPNLSIDFDFMDNESFFIKDLNQRFNLIKKLNKILNLFNLFDNYLLNKYKSIEILEERKSIIGYK